MQMQLSKSKEFRFENSLFILCAHARAIPSLPAMRTYYELQQ